jgi:ABC-2 type transport system permease protein
MTWAVEAAAGTNLGIQANSPGTWATDITVTLNATDHTIHVVFGTAKETHDASTAGKLAAAIAADSRLLAVTAVYMSIVFIYGNPAVKPLLSGYLGLLLFGGGFVAVGLFISSLTSNQMVAGAASFVVFLLFWIISWLGESMGPTMASIMSYLSITEHFDDFGKGIIDTKHIIFYLSFIALGLFLATKSVDSDRWRG